jgi:hypothetical protein
MTRKQIQSDIQRFLDAGGKIDHIPMGMGAYNWGDASLIGNSSKHKAERKEPWNKGKKRLR